MRIFICSRTLNLFFSFLPYYWKRHNTGVTKLVNAGPKLSQISVPNLWFSFLFILHPLRWENLVRGCGVVGEDWEGNMFPRSLQFPQRNPAMTSAFWKPTDTSFFLSFCFEYFDARRFWKWEKRCAQKLIHNRDIYIYIWDNKLHFSNYHRIL